MAAIEVITSQEKEVKVRRPDGKTTIILVRIWNETVSNLTLMALGSSAPEILLSVIEIFGNNFEAGDLGPGTIVGSAAFNRPRPPVVPPGSTGTGSAHADDQGAVYFPYFDMDVIFDDSRARGVLGPAGVRCPRLSEYFGRLMDYAARARWGKTGVTREEANELAAEVTTLPG